MYYTVLFARSNFRNLMEQLARKTLYDNSTSSSRVLSLTGHASSFWIMRVVQRCGKALAETSGEVEGTPAAGKGLTSVAALD